MGRLAVPAFRAVRGDFVCLHLPGNVGQDGWELPTYFVGRPPSSTISIHGHALFADKPMPRRKFLWRLSNPSVRQWLHETANLTVTEADSLLQRMNVNPKERIGTIPWTERSLLGLEAAILRCPDILVFDASGLPDEPARQMYRMVEAVLPKMAVVFVSYPCQPPRPCFAKARCFSVPENLTSLSDDAAA